MRKITVRDIKNEALKRRYNGGFIVEKRNLSLKEASVNQDTSYATSMDDVDDAVSDSSTHDFVINKSNTQTDTSKQEPTVQIQAKNTQDAKTKIAQANNNPNYKKLGNDVNYAVHVGESKRNQKIIENMKRNSVKFTKSELDELL